MNRGEIKGVKTSWICECECGNKKSINGSSLKSGGTKSCGCLYKKDHEKRIDDLTGMRFGKLIVMELDKEKTEQNRRDRRVNCVTWKCICDCGNTCSVSRSHLREANTCSCGCWRKESPKVLEGAKYGTILEECPNLVKFLVNKEDATKYSKKSNKKVDVVCDQCGTKKKISIIDMTTSNGIRCGKCRDGLSYGEKVMNSILTQLEEDYETEKTFSWSNRKRYDFYVKEKSCIIEIHGLQHYSGWFNSIEQEQDNDRFKLKIAKENGIKNYISLDCRNSSIDFIKESVKRNKEFCSVFDVSKIDWKKCEENTTTSLMISIIKSYNLGEKNTKELSKTYKVSRTTVVKYLKRGTNIGICNFNNERKGVKK